MFKISRYNLLLVFLIWTMFCFGQDPHLSGKITIDLNKGAFKCSLKVENLPKLSNYKILLNKGMNVKHFKDDAKISLNYDGYFNPFVKGEALGYSFRDNNREPLPLFESFNVEYSGLFPKYENEYNAFDFKGFIAINDKTLRAAEQSKWYPVVYDIDHDKFYDSYTYSLDIELVGGSTIFINGSSPIKKQVGKFISKKSLSLLLFVGNYEFIETKGDYIINSNITTSNADLVFNNIKKIKDALSQKLKEEFKDEIYLINHHAVNKRKEGSSWGFNTYPAFAFTGLNFNKLVKENESFSNSNLRYFSHEFAHNYFNNNVNSGVLKWFWLESIPEYLSFSVTRKIRGNTYVNEVIKRKIKALKDKTFSPLSTIENPNQIDEDYRYSLGPLLLQCFKIEFGETIINNTLISLYNKAKNKSLNLTDFRESAVTSGISNQNYKKFEAKFITDSDFKNNIFTF